MHVVFGKVHIYTHQQIIPNLKRIYSSKNSYSATLWPFVSQIASSKKTRENPNAPAGRLLVDYPQPRADCPGPAAGEFRPHFTGGEGGIRNKLLILKAAGAVPMFLQLQHSVQG